ncbi:DUF2293 domain-containing protein [Saccharomonospora sp. NPDC006951]
MSKLRQRVADAAAKALARQHYVAPFELFAALGWLRSSTAEEWRSGKLTHLAAALPVDEHRLLEAVGHLAEWARERALVPSETSYLSRTRDAGPLRFTSSARENVETRLRTHWLSPELTEKRRTQLMARQNKAPDLTVSPANRPWSCTECRGSLDEGDFRLTEATATLCLSCADFDHLTYLPSGNAALSRRARSESTLSVLVVRFNRRRKRLERQGILVEPAALERAEEQCLADEDLRARRRERDAERRTHQDIEFRNRFTAEILRLFPGCPGERASAIAAHAGTRGSGRVGRSAAGRALDENAIRMAVVASVRHLDTDYDRLLMAGVPRAKAREDIRAGIDVVLRRWESAGAVERA